MRLPSQLGMAGDFEELRAAHRRQRQRFQQRKQNGDRDRHAELEEEFSDDPLHEDDGQEDRDDRDRGRHRGEIDLPRADDARRGRLDIPIFPVAHDVFQHHDGVVDHDSDRERETEKRERVQREAEEIEKKERAHNGRGNGEDDVERRAPRSEEHPADERREERRQSSSVRTVSSCVEFSMNLVESKSRRLILTPIGHSRLATSAMRCFHEMGRRPRRSNRAACGCRGRPPVFRRRARCAGRRRGRLRWSRCRRGESSCRWGCRSGRR